MLITQRSGFLKCGCPDVDMDNWNIRTKSTKYFRHEGENLEIIWVHIGDTVTHAATFYLSLTPKFPGLSDQFNELQQKRLYFPQLFWGSNTFENNFENC